MLPNNPIILNSPQPQSETDRIKKVVSKNAIKGLSIVQLVCAVIAIITQIILLSRRDSRRETLWFEWIADIGAGMWTGFFFGVTGLIGLFASQKPSKCNLSAFLTLSIISSLLCIPLLVIASIGLSEESSEDYWYSIRTNTNYSKSATACYGFQIFVALVQAGVAIATSAMSCRIICCSKQDYFEGVVYSPAQNQPQQFMMVSPNQFSNPPQFVTVPSNQVAPFAQVGSPVVMQQHGPPPPSYGHENQKYAANVHEASLI